MLIDADEREFELQRQSLAQAGFELSWSADLKPAFEQIRSNKTDAVLLDLNLGQTKGVETVRAFRAVHQDVPLVVLTAQDDLAVTRDCLRADAQGFLVKGEQPWRIARAVENAIERHLYQSTLRDAFGSSEDGIAITTPEGEVLFANQAAVAMMPPTWTNQKLPRDFQVLPDGREVEIRVSEIRWNGLPARLVSLRAESPAIRLLSDHEGLMQIQKMEALGRLASGVANNLDKLLSRFVDRASVLAQENRQVEELLPAARSAALLNRQLVRLAGRTRFQQEAVELSQLADQTIFLLRPVLGDEITVNSSFAEEALVVGADQVQLQHLLVNLLINAREALVGSGVIRVRTECSDGRGVVLIEDSGSGIPPELRERVFEPFFTTRSGQLGMGLTTALGLASEWGGSLTLDSSRLGGLRVALSFPLMFEGEPRQRKAVEEEHPLLEGSVMLIDDEPLVLASLEKSLSKAGLEVRGYTSGQRALEEFRCDPARFDLVILDLRMPGMDGEACLQELRSLRSDLKVIVSSGFYNSVAEGLEATEVLYKPHTSLELLRMVRRVLK